MAVYHALIRTHHMTSRRKIAAIKEASLQLSVNAILRTSGFPGIMYACGTEEGVCAWVKTVRNLRYKDYQLAIKPQPCEGSADRAALRGEGRGSTLEVTETAEFRNIMEQRGLLDWWKKGMGFQGD